MYGDIKIILQNHIYIKPINSEYELDNYCCNLSLIIGTAYFKEIAIQLIRKYFFYFTESEQKLILNRAYEDFDYNIPKDYIYNQLKLWFCENDVLNVQGFVMFRLNEYKEYIYVILQEIVDKYIVELEQNQIIDYFKNVLENQTPYINTIYIYSEKQRYKIFNQNHEKLITIDNCDELLLNTMVSIAPETIYFYGICDNINFFNTLLKVFENRIKVINDQII